MLIVCGEDLMLFTRGYLCEFGSIEAASTSD
jgi:hypothetical protein